MSRRGAAVRPPPVGWPPPTPDHRPKNQLLASLSDDDFLRLHPYLTTVPIRIKQVLQRCGEPLTAVHFPNGGGVSITTTLADGTCVETATVGDEGMLGIEAFLGEDAVAPGETLVRVSGTSAERMSVGDFRREIAARGAFHALIGHYLQRVIAQMMLTTACNVRHPVQQRCARWLLMTHDRMHQQDFQVSHELIAVMLGQRPTVSVVAATLQNAGLIRYIHGRVTVRDRKGLEAASCACYALIRAHFPSPTAVSPGRDSSDIRHAIDGLSSTRQIGGRATGIVRSDLKRGA